jgi:pantoate--beta-alanine ligase
MIFQADSENKLPRPTALPKVSTMRMVSSTAAMQRLARHWRRQGAKTAFVPTMGYLHAGHLSLMRRARKLAGKEGLVVVSIYVNPAQFGPREDFSRYPRDLARDRKLCREAGVDVLFTPDDRQIYPENFSTFVVEDRLSRGMEGAARPGHFRGVTTIVAKLFNIVQPDFAVFGAKDFQQSAVIRRMVRDLNFPLKLVVAPTVRERGGVALSSRNKYLSPAQRRQATILIRCIQTARNDVKARGTISAASEKRRLERLIEAEPEARMDYVEFFDATSMLPARTVKKGVHLSLAVFIGKTRLIDNGRL